MLRLFALVALLIPCLAFAQPPEMAGTWKGTLEAGGAPLPLVFTVGEKTTLQSPAQGPALVPGEMTFEGGKLRLTFPAIGAGFEGVLDSDGKAIRGDFIQRGLRFPMALSRDGSVSAAINRPQMPKAPFPYRSEEVAYDNPAETGVRLAGTLTLPAGKGPFPAAILITGSGQQDRDESLMGHKPFLVIADHLTRRGIAVLRVDDRGVGGSTGEVEKATSVNFATDVEAGLAFLRKRPDIDGRSIGLLGHSEGGYIAPMVAAKDPNVAFIVMLAGPGASGAEVLALQSQLIAKAAGAPADALARADENQRRLLAIATGEGSDAEVRARVRESLMAAGLPEPQAGAQAAQLSAPWFRYFLRYDPAADLRKVTVPVLALLGAKDLQVDAGQNAPAIRAALAHNPKATVEVVPDANHLFQKAPTGAPSEYSAIETTIEPAVLDRVGDWVEAQVR